MEYGPNHSLNNLDYCTFAIEANPHHWYRLEEVSNAYTTNKNTEISGIKVELSWRWFTVIKAAALDQMGTTTLYHQGKEDEISNEWGFSLVHDYQKEENNNKKLSQINVFCSINMIEWMDPISHNK